MESLNMLRMRDGLLLFDYIFESNQVGKLSF